MNKIFSIAIDGPAGAGKSSIAKAAAEQLGAKYLDTGAMYRTVGLHYLRKGLLNDPEAIARTVGSLDIAVAFDGGRQLMYLNGEDVTEEIRTPEASMTASAVAAIPQVRAHLVQLQQEIAKGTSIVMDGRDIGTKVLPNATLKLYVTASAEVRAHRRYVELRGKFDEGKIDRMPVYHEVLDDIVERDYNDSHRAASPLEQAADAQLLDTSSMSLAQVLEEVARRFEAAVGGK